MLKKCGINQKVFLDFLETFDKSSQESRFFDVVNIGCQAVGLSFNPIAGGVAAGVQILVGIVMEMQIRHRQELPNTF